MLIGLAAAVAALLPIAAADPQHYGIACLWETMPAAIKAKLVATVGSETSTTADFEAVRVAMLPTAQACLAAEGWTQNAQVALTFTYAFKRASLTADGAELARLGVDQEAVLKLYPALDPAALALLHRVGTLNDAEMEQLGGYLEQFLTKNGPARQAPARGWAAQLLLDEAGLRKAGDDYRALGHQP